MSSPTYVYKTRQMGRIHRLSSPQLEQHFDNVLAIKLARLLVVTLAETSSDRARLGHERSLLDMGQGEEVNGELIQIEF